MALANYTQLRSAIASWLNRADLTAIIPDFITLAEAQMNRRLRARPMVTRAEAAIASEYTAVPADFLAPRRLTLEASESDIRVLSYLAPERLLAVKEGLPVAARPEFYSFAGGELQVLPAPDQAYTAELLYYGKIPSLSEAQLSNWVLANHPDAYLYGALVQAAPYLVDDARIAVWGDLFLGALAGIERADRVPGGSLRAEPALARAPFQIATNV